MTDLHNANNALKFLDGKGINTTQGRVFLASDVEEAIRIAQDERVTGALAPQPKTMVQAKRMAARDQEIVAGLGQDRIAPPGSSVPAMSPESSSRT